MQAAVHPRRVALLDDSAEFAEIVRDVLDLEAGYTLDVHTSWEDAVAFVKAHRPDLVLLDLLFGGEQQGLVILLELKGDPATERIPVIVCSADRASLEGYSQLLADYDVPFIEKPFEVDEFLGLVRGALATQASEPIDA